MRFDDIGPEGQALLVETCQRNVCVADEYNDTEEMQPMLDAGLIVNENGVYRATDLGRRVWLDHENARAEVAAAEWDYGREPWQPR